MIWFSLTYRTFQNFGIIFFLLNMNLVILGICLRVVIFLGVKNDVCVRFHIFV